MVSHYFFYLVQLTGGSHPSGGHLLVLDGGHHLARGILLLNGDYLLKLGLEPHIGGNQSSWGRHGGALPVLPTFFEEFVRQRPQLFGQCLFLGVLRLHGLARQHGQLVGRCSLPGDRCLQWVVCRQLFA